MNPARNLCFLTANTEVSNRMKRFFVSSENVSGSKLYIKDTEAHHIKTVLRLKKGDSIAAFDENGKEYKGIITGLNPKQIIVCVSTSFDSIPFHPPYYITLAQAIPKLDKMDYVIQKATELGVNQAVS